MDGPYKSWVPLGQKNTSKIDSDENRDIHDKYSSRENGDFPSLRNSRSVDRKL
jgi:hypothetical protein